MFRYFRCPGLIKIRRIFATGKDPPPTLSSQTHIATIYSRRGRGRKRGGKKKTIKKHSRKHPLLPAPVFTTISWVNNLIISNWRANSIGTASAPPIPIPASSKLVCVGDIAFWPEYEVLGVLLSLPVSLVKQGGRTGSSV